MRKQKINNKKTFMGKYILWFFLSALVVANVYLCVESATSGAEIAYRENQEKTLSEESNSLSEGLLKMASLKQVEGQALSLGFGKPTSILYLNGEESVAKLP